VTTADAAVIFTTGAVLSPLSAADRLCGSIPMMIAIPAGLWSCSPVSSSR
jgi:hypothetical protein